MRKWISSALLIAATLTVGAGAALAQSENWGLAFPSPGEKPTGNATARALMDLDAHYVGETDEKVLYLTFDAGYENGYTAGILDALKAAEVPAAFFLVGTYIRDNPDLVARMVAEGHTVGNHTMHHPDMSAISDVARFQAELEETADHYRAAVGEEMPKLYRPPQGTYNEKNLEMAQSLGYTTIFWSLAYVDWNVDDQPSKEEAFEKLIPRVHPGAVLLLHSTSATNGEILGELIQAYQDLGYTFRPIAELLGG